MNILIRAYIAQKKFSEETCPKIYLSQDPELDTDSDVFKSRIWIQIRSKIVRIRNTANRLKYRSFLKDDFNKLNLSAFPSLFLFYNLKG
jgi:hypothetical protein